jgi:DMSO/TMAO reductase YedYZ molybdopterin-dependent catalytic subunit
VFGSGLRHPEGITLSLRDLHRLLSHTTTAFIECTGNGRSFFASQQGTPAPGSQWKLRAIGVARWRGVRLRDVLERAGITRHAVDVMPEGLDAEVAGQGHVRRPLPVRKALDDVLIAYEMNGEPLPPDHGAPARLVVSGWIGVASIKWLGRIEVADQPLFSPWNTTQYRLTGPAYPPDEPPLTRQAVKSAFELPFGAALPAGRRHVLTGRSWFGRRADPPRRRQHRRRPHLRAGRAARTEPPERLDPLAGALPPPQAGQLRADRARHRLARAHAAPDCPVQRRRIPVLGRRPPSRPSHLTGGPA